MRFRLLGPLQVEAGAHPFELGPPKQRSVLAVLLLHANEIVSTDRIIDLVWGEDPPRTADHSVQIYISELRKALANGALRADLIETRPPGYVINVPPESIDITRFERLVRDGLNSVRAGDSRQGADKLTSAVEAWTGSPLTDFAFEDFAQGHIRSLMEMRSDALETLAGVCLRTGDLDKARDLARRAIEADPLREEPRRLMMLVLYRTGRQAEALRHFREYRDLLVDEMGIEPSEPLRDLEERILLQDPGLDDSPRVEMEGNPYRGLRAFSEDDADLYFGREKLVAEVLDRLRNGPGFVSIVGPSGSGKSSAARAGVVPPLREAGETVVVMQPGSRPLWELAGALDQAGFGTRASLLRRFETDPKTLIEVISRPLMMIVDQFEEVFTLAEPDAAVRFSELIAAAVRDHRTPMRVVATLRADYYDKPLSMPALAAVFSDSVVSVKPMTPDEIERAVVEPAGVAGVSVNPALLAQLVSDMGDEPGALPLLQFTLFELFEKGGSELTLSGYRELGGLRGALVGGADELLGEFDAEGQNLVEQVMLRMVQKGRALNTSRPVPVRDLIELGVDITTLQRVLEAFSTRRLITFDRDASGVAVVEIAHEYLLSQWPRFVSWIDEHAEDLDRLYSLDAATEEWTSADRSQDYLLRGDRLDRFEDWRNRSSLRLTSTEMAFIDASVELRDKEEALQRERSEKEAVLARRARRRLWAFGTTVAALAAAVTVLVLTLLPEPPPDVIVWFNGRGDSSFGDLIGNGVDLAREANPGLEIVERYDAPNEIDSIGELVGRGVSVAFLELSKIEGIDPIPFMSEYPDTHFVIIDCPTDAAEFWSFPPNSSCVGASNEELGFLAGVAAALASETGRVGFIGGVDIEVIWQFQAGFEQGVSFVDEGIETDSVYLTPSDDFSGFSSWTLGEAASAYLESRGADVLFSAAGFSGFGMFEHARQQDPPLWTIGVDIDQYYEVEHLFEDARVASMRELMLTSVVKRLDFGIADAIAGFAETGTVDDVHVSLANDGVQYTKSGGHIEPWVAEMEAAIAAVKDGSVVVDPWARSGTVLLFDRLQP